jgi:outer membrane receptor protein involved in Fe transport
LAGGLNWKPDRDSLIYANVTKGYKAGTFPSVTAILASQYEPIKQESVLAYELGFKLEPISRVQLSGAAFYYKYNDKQLQGIRFVPLFGNLPALVSVPKSEVRGAELEATVRPLQRLRLSGGVTYIDSKVQRAPVDAITGQPTIVDRILGPFDITGKAFPNTPKWNAVSDAEYGFPLSNQFSGFIGASATYRSSTLAVFSLSPQFKMNSYTLLDLRAGLETSDGKLRLQVWGHNVTDKYYWIQATATGDTFTRVPGMPATFGVTLTGRF